MRQLIGGFKRISGYPVGQRIAQILLVLFCTLWLTPLAGLILLLAYLFGNILAMPWWCLLAVGCLFSYSTLADLIQTVELHPLTLLTALWQHGHALQVHFWQQVRQHQFMEAFYQTLWQHPSLGGLALALAGMFNGLAQAKTKPTITANFAGAVQQEVSIAQKPTTGTRLGESLLRRQPVVISDNQVNQVVLVLGTTGGGKTVTLRRFYERAVEQHYPLIIVDGKPTQEAIEKLERLANQYQCPFYGFNSGNYAHYNPLAEGGYTELKDKLMCLKDDWENDYYRTVAEDYLQTVFAVLLQSQSKNKRPLDLTTVIDCLDFDNLALIVRYSNHPELTERVKHLANYEAKDISGLQAHLRVLLHSELGAYLLPGEHNFSLSHVLKEGAVAYFALPALRYPQFASTLGKLVINDIKTTIDRQEYSQPIFTIFDEFSLFAGQQVLNLINMGRGKGIHAILGTQGIADLEKVEPAFASQVLNCVNTLICHRLNDQTSSEAVAEWVGTKDAFEITTQLDTGGSTGLGSLRKNKAFIIHPDSIKQHLQPGQAFVVSKVNGFYWDKVQVQYS